MGLPQTFSKQLAAASATNIAASQSPGAGAIVLNGTASNRLSTTTTAATAAGVAGSSNILTLTSTAGLVAGQAISDTTAPGVIPSGAVVLGKTSTTVTMSLPVGGAGVGNGDTIVFAGIATLDTQRRVLITSGGNDSGITFTINGAGDNGVPIQDTITGGNVAAVASNLDFLTVSSITHTGSVAGTLTVGTTGVGSTPWFGTNWHAQPFNLDFACEVASGAVNFTVQHTYDDPNNLASGVNFPLAFNHPVVAAASATTDGAYANTPIAAIRYLINSGTGLLRGRLLQAGISGQ